MVIADCFTGAYMEDVTMDSIYCGIAMEVEIYVRTEVDHELYVERFCIGLTAPLSVRLIRTLNEICLVASLWT